MPCRSYPEDFPEEMNKLTQEKLDVVSRIACKALDYIEKTDNAGLLALILKDKGMVAIPGQNREKKNREIDYL